MILWQASIFEFVVIPLLTLIFTILAKGVSRHNLLFKIETEDYLVCFDLLVLSIFIYMVNMGKTFSQLQEVSSIVRAEALNRAQSSISPEALALYAEQEQLYESKLGIAIPIVLAIALMTVTLIFATKSQFARDGNGNPKTYPGIVFPNVLGLIVLIIVSLVTTI
ncbi:MAG: hypothetical protein AB4050_01125 [Synechococcus sp.]